MNPSPAAPPPNRPVVDVNDPGAWYWWTPPKPDEPRDPLPRGKPQPLQAKPPVALTGGR